MKTVISGVVVFVLVVALSFSAGVQYTKSHMTVKECVTSLVNQ